jgi:hypothetical protein
MTKKSVKKVTKKSVKKPVKKQEKEMLPATQAAPVEIIQNLVLKGDIKSMTGDEKVKYYTHLCKSIGLNPLTQPFQILNLQGKEVLYATKTATEQLRKIYGISVESISQRVEFEICITTVTVRDRTGRTDGATGAVNIKGLSGDALCNAYMKSETKAKRRATLSISGLGFIDESEIEIIPGAVPTQISIQEPQEPIDIDAVFKDYAKKIDECTNVKAIVTIGNDIKNQSLPDEMLAELREKYHQKVKQLTAPEDANV